MTPRLRHRRLWSAAAAALLVAILSGGAPCLAGDRDLLVWAPYNPGSREQATPIMTEFARQLETAAGWPSGSMSVTYHNTVEGGLEALEESSPGFVMVPLPVFLGHQEAQHWQAIRSMALTVVESQRYTLLGPPGSSLDSVDKPVIAGSPAYDERFVRAIVLGKRANLEVSGFRPTGNPLPLIRRTAAGEPVLVLVDEGQLRALERMPDLMDNLVPLAESGLMPTALVARGPGATNEDAQALSRALDRFAKDEQAQEVRQTMNIRQFEAVDEKLLEELIKTYTAAGGTSAPKRSQEAGKQ